MVKRSIINREINVMILFVFCTCIQLFEEEVLIPNYLKYMKIRPRRIGSICDRERKLRGARGVD